MSEQLTIKKARHRHFCQACVMLSLRIFSSKLQSEQGFFVLFCGWGKNILLFYCVCRIYDIYL
jgi:hypothetical protein